MTETEAERYLDYVRQTYGLNAANKEYKNLMSTGGITDKKNVSRNGKSSARGQYAKFGVQLFGRKQAEILDEHDEQKVRQLWHYLKTKKGGLRIDIEA